MSKYSLKCENKKEYKKILKILNNEEIEYYQKEKNKPIHLLNDTDINRILTLLEKNNILEYRLKEKDLKEKNTKTENKESTTISNDVKLLLFELGYTKDQMQTFWDECKEINYKVKNLADMGKTWSDLPLETIKDLPTLKERTLLALERKERNNPVIKLQENQSLTEEDIKYLISQYGTDTYYHSSPNMPNVKSVVSFIKIEDKDYLIEWSKVIRKEGVIEFYENQPEELDVSIMEAMTQLYSKWSDFERAKELEMTIDDTEEIEEIEEEDYELD